MHYIISLQKLDEATSLLGPTCDTFIQTLDDCMKIIQSSLPFEGSHPHVTDAALPTSPLKKVPSRKVKFSLKIIRHRHLSRLFFIFIDMPSQGFWGTRAFISKEQGNKD